VPLQILKQKAKKANTSNTTLFLRVMRHQRRHYYKTVWDSVQQYNKHLLPQKF